MFHKISEPDPDSRIGTCEICGPGVPIHLAENNRWRCTRLRRANQRENKARKRRQAGEKAGYWTYARLANAYASALVEEADRERARQYGIAHQDVIDAFLAQCLIEVDIAIDIATEGRRIKERKANSTVRQT